MLRVFKLSALLIALSCAISSLPLQAQEATGAPEALIGHWGNSPQQCRSYHRKSDGLITFDRDFFAFCGGSHCDARILKHKKTHDGFILSLASRGNPEGWHFRVKIADENVIELIGGGIGGRDETLVRCSKSDAIAGIGLSSRSGGLTKSLDGIFAAYYALAIPAHCPKLTPNASLAKAIIEAGRLMWRKFLLEGPNARSDPESGIKSTKREAEYAARTDAVEIENFCDKVLDAFGNVGRVLPNMINDPRKKA